MKIEGVPEGWELVRIGFVEGGEHYIGSGGRVVHNNGIGVLGCVFPVVRKVEPACSWPHGVFADGWLFESSVNSGIDWCSEKPVWSADERWWLINGGSHVELPDTCFLNPPVFRADLPWRERIQQVGPTVEKGAV